jgi:hypothetical protein
MKTTIRFKSILALLTICGLCVFAGCKTTNPTTGQKEYDPVKTEQVKAAIEPIAAGAIRRVVLNSPQHADEIANYLRSVGRIFCSMETNGNFSAEYLISEADKLTAPLIKDNYVADIKNAILALYRINYADRFKAELPPDKWPRHVASLFCASIDRGLRDAGKPGVR